MANPPANILALVPNWLGDVAMCTPALRALHRRFPEAALTVAGRAGPCALLEGIPWIAHFEPLPAKPGFLGALRVGRRLRPFARDLAVVFPHAFRAAVLAAACRARRRIGYDRDGRGFLLTDRVAPHRVDGRIQPVYMACEYLALVAPLGCEDDGQGLELHADPVLRQAISARFDARGPRVGFAPGGAFGGSKRWLPERFAAVADALVEQAGAQCVLLTGPGEEATRRAVIDAAHAPWIACDGGKPSIAAMKAAIAELDLLVCNDSGTRHVAVAFGVPTVCIMGSTRPCYSEGPYERGRVVRVDVDCGPCQLPECPVDHRCMTGVSAEMVIQAALDVLREEGRRPS